MLTYNAFLNLPGTPGPWTTGEGLTGLWSMTRLPLPLLLLLLPLTLAPFLTFPQDQASITDLASSYGRDRRLCC